MPNSLLGSFPFVWTLKSNSTGSVPIRFQFAPIHYSHYLIGIGSALEDVHWNNCIPTPIRFELKTYLIAVRPSCSIGKYIGIEFQLPIDSNAIPILFARFHSQFFFLNNICLSCLLRWLGVECPTLESYHRGHRSKDSFASQRVYVREILLPRKINPNQSNPT